MKHSALTKKISDYTIRFEIPLKYYSYFIFLDSFFNSNELPDISIIFFPSHKNKFVSSINDATLFFYFDEEKLSEIKSYNVTWEIGILQAICRFIGLISIVSNRSTFLVHGTSIELKKNQGLCILGNGSGKTSLGIAFCRLGLRFISDEFSFLNLVSNNVYKVAGLPIHIRKDAKKYLKCDDDNPYDIHVLSEQIGLCEGNTSKVIVTIFPEVTGKFTIRQLTKEEANFRYKEALVDHIRKFMNPALDRVSINPDTSGLIIPKGFNLCDYNFAGLDSFIENKNIAYHVTLGSIEEITLSSQHLLNKFGSNSNLLL